MTRKLRGIAYGLLMPGLNSFFFISAHIEEEASVCKTRSGACKLVMFKVV